MDYDSKGTGTEGRKRRNGLSEIIPWSITLGDLLVATAGKVQGPQ